MSNYKLEGNKLRDRSGTKIGQIDGMGIRDGKNRIVGSFDTKYIRDSSGKKIAEFDGTNIRDGQRNKIGTINDVKKIIDGDGEISLVALWCLLLR